MAAVISKKTAKLAVARHLLKRRMLAVGRPWARPDQAVVIYARAGAPGLPYPALRDELSGLLRRVLGPEPVH
jgi:ribonuclease P protein component